MESRRIRVSQKRQLTIPQKFYEQLNISDEVECILCDGELLIRPVREHSAEFSDLILEDLIERGLSGQALLKEFRKVRNSIRPAVEKMVKEAEDIAKGSRGSGDGKMTELFGDLED